MFELTQKINQFIRLLLNHRTQQFAQGNALHELAQARLFAKNQQWLEASELYLEWIILNNLSTSNVILREFFFCLSHTQNHDENCCIELGLHLLTKETHDKNPQILNIVLKKYLHLQAPAEALSTLLYFSHKDPSLKNDTTLLITHAEILALLKRDREAEIILTTLREHAKQSSDIDIQVELLAVKIDYLQEQPTQAGNRLQRLLRHFPEHHDIKHHLALHYFKYGNLQEGEALLESLKDDDKYFIDYLRHLFTIPGRYHDAMEQADRRLLSSIKKDEIQSIQILQAFHHENYQSGKMLFDALLTTHHNPGAIIPILLEFINFYQQYDDIPYYKNLLKLLHQTREIPYSLQILANRHISPQLYQHTHHRYPQLILPDFIHDIFQELWHPDFPKEELFLVGGAVLQLLKKIPLTHESDLDFIFMTERTEIVNYVPSRFIENLYVRDRHRLGGYAVDLKVIRPSLSEKDVLSENTLYRDYTICALFCNQQGVLFDPTGRALEDFEQKRLDTISDAKSTLREDPVRILRAFKYIARGFKTSPELEAALNETHSIDFANHAHFNQVLLKECQSFKNIEFIEVMIKYDFFKYLGYCQIPEMTLESGNPLHICQYLIQGLVIHKEALPLKKHYSKIYHELESLQKTLTLGIEEKTQQIQELQANQEQLNMSNRELKEKIIIRSNQMMHAQNQSQLQQEKLKKIQSLEQQILKKRQKNEEKQKRISQMDETITAQYQEEFEKKSNELHALRSKFNQQWRQTFQQQQKYVQQIQSLKKNVETQQALLTQNEQRWQDNQRRQTLIQQVKDTLMSNTYPEIISFENEEDIFTATIKHHQRYQEYPNPNALEQMCRIVCFPDLKAYLHAHLAIRGLQLSKESQNRFKIHYHLKSFLAFLPSSLIVLYQTHIDAIIAELDLPAFNPAITPIEYVTKAKQCALELCIEEAIYFYEQAISLYAIQNKEKPYFEALIELASLHARQYDFSQVEKIFQKLRRIKNQPHTVQSQTRGIYESIQMAFQEFKALSKRKYTYPGFLDFWPASLTRLSELKAHTQIDMTLALKKNIYEDIIQNTLYEEEWMLAQIEYAYLLRAPSHFIQWKMIQSFESQNPDIEILLEYAKFQGIPEGFHQFFANKDLMQSFRRRPLNPNLDEIYLIYMDNYPYDIKTFKHLINLKLCPSLLEFVNFNLGLAYIEDALVWEAQFHLQREGNTPQKHYDFKYYIDEANLLKPELSWDCCDSTAWYTYAQRHPENEYLLRYCYYQTLLFNPYHYEALYALLLLFHKQKNFKMLWSTLALAGPVIKQCDGIFSLSVKLFHYQEVRNQILSLHQTIMKQSSLIKNRALLQEPQTETIDFKRNHLNKALLWRAYDVTMDDEMENQSILEKIIHLSITHDVEYALAHFEWARLLDQKEPLLAQYHLQESTKTWFGLLFMQKTEFISDIPYHLDVLKKEKCMLIYQEVISSEMTKPENQNPQFYLEYFQFILETNWVHLIQSEHIIAFLAIETLSKIQRIEGNILLGEYDKANALLPEEESEVQIEQSQQRLFEFSINEKAMNGFLLKLRNEWSNKFMALNDFESQDFYLQKSNQLDEYLSKFTEIETSQLTVGHS